MKKIFRLIIKGCCVMMPFIVICIYTWINPLGFMDEEAPYYLWNREKTNQLQDKLYHTIILGDSVANAAYVPEILSDTTINLALGGTTPVENYYILEEWLNHQQLPDVCYISFLDEHLQHTDNFWTRTMYSHRFKPEQIIEILKAAVKYRETSYITENYITDFIAYELCLPNKYITSLMNAGFNQRKEDNITAMQLNDLHGGRYIARGTSEYDSFNEISYHEFHVNPLFHEYYEKMIRLCIEKNIQVRIIKLPQPDNVKFTSEYRKAVYTYYADIHERYPEITMDWFSSYQKTDFVDESHMNSHGALKFSNELKELYPDDFSDAFLSMEQVAGINDSLLHENKIDQIIQWIFNKDYILLLNDKTGKFASAYDEVINPSKCVLNKFDIGSWSDNSVFYYISGINRKNVDISVLDTENAVMVQINNQETWRWDTSADHVLHLVVFDCYNNQVVCMKSFKYGSENFTLAAKKE